MQCVMKLHVNVLKISYFFYRIIDRITRFSFIILSDFIHFMKCFILSIMDYHVLFFSPLLIIYCILWFVCQSLYNKSVRSTGQKPSLYILYVCITKNVPRPFMYRVLGGLPSQPYSRPPLTCVYISDNIYWWY